MNANHSRSVFSLARVHPFEWLVGLGGVGLTAGLMLNWSGGESAFASPGFLDVMLLLLGVLAMLLPVVVASSYRTNVPVACETLLWTVSLLFGVLLLVKAAFPPNDGFDSGFWLVLAATLVISFSVWRSVGRER